MADTSISHVQKAFRLHDGTDLESAATDKDAWKDVYLAYSILCNSVECNSVEHKLLGSLLECKTSREICITSLSAEELICIKCQSID